MALITISGDGGKFYDWSKDSAGNISGAVCRNSYGNSPFVSVTSAGTHFRSDRNFNFVDLPADSSMNLGSDGIGTKVVLHDTIGHYRDAAFDLLAMWLDDVSRFWGVPLVFTNVLDVKSLWTPEQMAAYKELMEWLAKVAKEQSIVVISWETASLWSCVSSPNPNAVLAFNWSWAVLWSSNPSLSIDPYNVDVGHKIVALKQDGFRSNGISKVRAAFEAKYGPNWYQDAPREEIEAAGVPSVPYARAISEANGWFNNWEKLVRITWVAHLSWGGFRSKFLEPILDIKWLSAHLPNLYPIPDIAKKAFWWLQWTSWEMNEVELFTTWCCGQWMLVMLPTLQEAEDFIHIVSQFGIEWKVAWEIIKTPNEREPNIYLENTL